MGYRTRPALAGGPRTHSPAPRGWAPPPGDRQPTVTTGPGSQPSGSTLASSGRCHSHRGPRHTRGELPKGGLRGTQRQGVPIPSSMKCSTWGIQGPQIVFRAIWFWAGNISGLYSRITWRVPEEGACGWTGRATLDCDDPNDTSQEHPPQKGLQSKGLL